MTLLSLKLTGLALTGAVLATQASSLSPSGAEVSLTTVLQGAGLAILVYVAKTTKTNSDDLIKVRQALWGEDGEGGLVREFRAMWAELDAIRGSPATRNPADRRRHGNLTPEEDNAL